MMEHSEYSEDVCEVERINPTHRPLKHPHTPGLKWSLDGRREKREK